ncbi:hypothetical protein ACI6Q2_20610 [Chitinophagaceae bacterium LWZ2-11]
MKIKYGKQVEINELVEDIDLFLLAGNHEKRVFTAFDKVTQLNISKAIMFCYKDFKCPRKYSNIKKEVIQSHEQIFDILDEELSKIEKNNVTIFVDYSCMTKSWYYSIILYLSNKKIDVQNITVYFSYTSSKYSPPQKPKPNSEIAPLPGKYIVPTDKPKALIVCLGYERNKAEGIIDHLDPKVSYIFYTKPALDEKFIETLETNNKNILSNKQNNIITYPFDDLLFLERELTSLYYLLKDEYSIIIAPLGPKPFTFISMLMAVKYKDIDIWRVGSGSDINEYPRQPIDKDKLIISEVVWE